MYILRTYIHFLFFVFFFNDTATTEIYTVSDTLSLHDALPIFPTPPTMRNHGNRVASLAKLGRWLADQAEESGAMILPETAATKLLVDHGRVRGIRTGDKGRGRDGEELPNFEPGSDLVARLTVLAEGTQGHLTGAAIEQFGLE